ncbi:RagB/SusD family nutrient uptake outer membrane protein [Chitinophaga sp.]|uniref:RagB/SusD family nutrient uptake outer membrane protein n=1 Tax=Chitinophaga sp. TaxID=1869181 RepID=UPI002BF9F568|nr:RagB/SusD family nutrient uptake outer membrane protein [Chitinophaga sp.]HWV67614.1 RagB/SusD family nutrient uptake outer membrane protein [Chitinophaga sp.]
MNINSSYKFLLAALMLGTSCNKFVDVALPNSQISTAAAFADDEKANSSMRGIYASTQNVLGSGPFSGVFSSCLGLASDELKSVSYNDDNQAFADNNLTAGSSGVSAIWTGLYNTLYQVNVLLENVKGAPGVSAPVKQQLLGEAHFLRAYCYFYLVNSFGDVPMPVTSDYRVNALLPRTPADKVYELILSDLAYAQENAGAAYTAAGKRIRVNKWTATALLARVQLYRKNWVEAEKQATAVIGAGPYTMESLNNVFLLTSKEAIFQFANAGTNIYTIEGGRMTGKATNPNYRFTTWLAKAFETGDQRLASWTLQASNGDTAYYKYKAIDSGIGEAVVMFRLAEQYLIRAEARAQQNKLADAIADIDVIRKRAGLPVVANVNPGIAKDALLQLIYKERMTELFGEQGHRWFDVKRTGQADALYSVRKPRWRKEAILLPIPLDDRQKNPNLTQNEGYE